MAFDDQNRGTETGGAARETVTGDVVDRARATDGIHEIVVAVAETEAVTEVGTVAVTAAAIEAALETVTDVSLYGRTGYLVC